MNGDTPFFKPPHITPDYNQNNEKSKEYIKGRPFYTDTPLRSPVLHETSRSLTSTSDGYVLYSVEDYLYSATINTPYVFKAYNKTTGDTYVINDVIFEKRDEALFAGNPSLLDLSVNFGDSSKDYSIVWRGEVLVAFKGESGEYEITLSHPNEEEAVLVSEGTYDLSKNSAVGSYMMHPLLHHLVTPYNTYTLTINDPHSPGEKIKYNDIVLEKLEEGIFAAGDLSSLSSNYESTGEDYLLMYVLNESILVIGLRDDIAKRQISLTAVLRDEVVHKLDRKYLDVPYEIEENGDVRFEEDVLADSISLRSTYHNLGDLQSHHNKLRTEFDNLKSDHESFETEVDTKLNNIPDQVVVPSVVKSSGPTTLGYSRYKCTGASTGDPIVSRILSTTEGAWIEGKGLVDDYTYYGIEKYANNGGYSISNDLLVIPLKSSYSSQLNSLVEKLSGFSYLVYGPAGMPSESMSYAEVVGVTGNSSENSITIKLKSISGLSYGNTAHVYSLVFFKELGVASHSENMSAAFGDYSHSEGEGTVVGEGSTAQHVQGRYNIIDTEDKYVHIVGNGSDPNSRSNAHTVDWDGNAWYAGKVRAKDVVLEDDEGNIVVESVTKTLEDLQSSKINVSGATAGQIIKVSDVDENGTPTAWESVDFPSTEEKWEHICDIDFVTDEEVTVVQQDLGAEYRKLLLYVNKDSAGGLTSGGGDSYQMSIKSGAFKEIARVVNSANKGWAVHTFQIEWIQGASKFISRHSCNTNTTSTDLAGPRTDPFSELSFHTDGTHTDGTVFTFGNFTMNIYGVRV